jgi:streptogramin lyase
MNAYGSRLAAAAAGLLFTLTTLAAGLEGQVRDLNGKPVAGAIVTLKLATAGPTATSVFSDAAGRFVFPANTPLTVPPANAAPELDVRALGYELVSTGRDPLTLVVKATANQLRSAPASAWLRAGEREATSSFVLDCIGCHQVPGAQARLYAGLIADVPGTDRQAIAHQGWEALIKYMNFISAEEFGRGPEARSIDASRVYSVGNGPKDVDYLVGLFPGRMESVTGYDWGAPLAVTARTSIREYEVPRPNAVREAVLLGRPRQLYVADVSSNRIFKVDPATGRSTSIEVPHSGPVGPHSLHRGPDGSLWIAPFVSSVIARLDPANDTWKTWPMRTSVGDKPVGIHDLSFGVDHTLLTDRKGLVWYSDIGNNAVGYLDPRNGHIEIYPAPVPAGRTGNGTLYGFAMSQDREHVWFTQMSIGHVGSFNVRTRKFDDSILLPTNSGPRRMAMGDDGLLYVALYGSGQLLVYDTKRRQRVALVDLPDRASAPYAVTWDPVRKVVWVPTSNADVIYRFDPATRGISVLPLPRTGAFLRMLDVDPETGWLVTAYGNIVEQVHGPRMAVIVDPGDGAYDRKEASR